eukprot:TRINITY_DN303_c0_g1_i6.p1 TRINITY_DN303_c0_g1~~TRINITY_DN303_c0_g1_i6.p1  ORF type:complete len:1318 (-),score=418.92 TRINITY_DN303_c0_g1_i6:568-4521(-)
MEVETQPAPTEAEAAMEVETQPAPTEAAEAADAAEAATQPAGDAEKPAEEKKKDPPAYQDAFELEYTPDWPEQMKTKMEEAKIAKILDQLKGKGGGKGRGPPGKPEPVRVFGKDGTSYDFSWEGENPALEPVPAEDNFPLRVEERFKKARGKPKDPNAPIKPKNGFQKVTGEARARLKEERPELAMDLKAMGAALKEEWEKVPQEEKDRLQEIYDKEMEVFRPLWAAYKETDSYKEYCDVKQVWLDGREKKKLFKAHAKQAPKKPRSGYGIFSGEIRERVKTEVMARGGGMGDIGVQISEEWAAVPEVKKAEYAEQAQREKEEFAVKWEAHKETDIFKKFMTDKAKMEGRHKLKQLERTTFKTAPAKPKSSFALFKTKFMPEVMAENKGAAAGEISKKVGEKWKNTPAEERAPFEAEAATLKEKYLVDLKKFKCQKAYTKFLVQRQITNSRTNRAVLLREAPKKAKSVFALYRDAHKEEVPSGKGEGKGMSWVKAKYAEADQTEKQQIEAMQKELTEKYQEQVKAWKEGETYKEWLKNEEKYKREMRNEAMKVMTLKFLDTAPPQPPKTAFSVFVSEKRKAANSDGEPPAKRSRKDAKEEVAKFQEEFKKLDKDLKSEYEDRRKELVKEWQALAKEYMEKPIWKEYMEEAKLLKVPVKSLLANKVQSIKKLKNGTKILPLPEKPEDVPIKPPGAYKLFVRVKKQEVDDVSKLPDLWAAASAEEKKPFETEAGQLLNQYQEAVKAFNQSEAGREFIKKMKFVRKSRTIAMAKDKYTTTLPKKPLGATKLFMKAKLKEAKKANPEMKNFELQKLVMDQWAALDDEGKKPFQEQAAEAESKYQDTMAKWKESDEYKSYTSMIQKASGSGGGPAAPKRPDSYPSKPLDAFKAFCKEQAGQGKALPKLAEEFKELDAETKARFQSEATERQKKYQEEMIAWAKSDEGKKYNSAVKAFSKRKRLAMAKTKYLKDVPKKPVRADQIFFAEKRSEVMKENPELKGLGPVMTKLGELWKNLSEEDRKPYKDQAAEKMQEYDKAMAEFKSSANYKKYEAIARGAKPKAKAKAKASSSGPKPPDNYPKKPQKAMGLFMQENKGGGDLKAQLAAWRDLKAEGQKKYVDQAKEAMKQYEKDMEEFKESAEGKKYLRLKEASEKKGKLDKAKKLYLEGEGVPKAPKPPLNAYQMFVAEKRPSMTGEMAQVAKELSRLWGEMDGGEERKALEAKAKELQEQYQKDLKAYKESDGYKKYMAVSRGIKNKPPPAAKKPAKPKKAPKAKATKAKKEAKPKGKAKAKAKAKAAASGSDSDVMGSDSDSDSDSSDSD